jgi:hypothetical protein
MYSFPLKLDENYEGTEGSDTEQQAPLKFDAFSLIKYHEEFFWPLIPEMGSMRLDKLKAIFRAYVITVYREQSLFLSHQLFTFS